VAVDGKPVGAAPPRTYLVLNKQVGVLTTARDDRGRATVMARIPAGSGRVFPVGRLDVNSRGLVLLTNDGDLAVRLMHPRYHVEKEYRVLVSGRPTADAVRRLQGGMSVGAERFAPAEVRVLDAGDDRTRLGMVLREGRKREVRRMWRALGHRVLDLERVRLGPLRLGTLPPGAARALTPAEARTLRRAVGLEP
jgi:23S rRNA pseudouridine2605 synthase